MRSINKKIIHIFIIINLILLSLILLGKIHFICKLAVILSRAFIIPIIISILLFYLIRPLNDIFIKKGISRGKSSLLSLTICTFIVSGLISYFTKYAYKQFNDILKQLMAIINDKDQIDGVVNWINQFINVNEIYSLLVNMVKTYISKIGRSFKMFIGYFMNAFSIVFLIIVIVFYMLKDGNEFKAKVVFFVPEKYKDITEKILCESDEIISHYVAGQAKVALYLSLMIFLGYKIIGMPDAILLSVITFILAFIPIVGFFISMIIPGVIALSMGLSITLKFSIMFIIVQTLKSRVIVPSVMSKSMKIHPLTDIFLVIVAIGIGGTFAAFAVVPVYAILKNICIILNIFGLKYKV